MISFYYEQHEGTAENDRLCEAAARRAGCRHIKWYILGKLRVMMAVEKPFPGDNYNAWLIYKHYNLEGA